MVNVRSTLRMGVCAASLLIAAQANAGKILDYIRDYDLNDYAFGVSTSVSQNPYTTATNSVIVYPFLTSFQHAAFTDDWLLLSDGELGARKVTGNQWVFGAVGRINTLGLGKQRTDELLGLNDRGWGVEISPLVGYRGWPVHIQGRLFKEISGRHGGLTGEFDLSLPMNRHWGYVVPGLKFIAYDEEYMRYYYGVTESESRPDRPVYTPDAEQSYKAYIRWGYQISEKWLLLGSFAYEKLGDGIYNSPIVDRDHLWSGDIGLAYNADVFQPRRFAADAYRMPRWEFRVGLFQDNVRTVIVPEDGSGAPLPPIEVEDLLAISGRETVLHLDAIWRIGNFHRLEASYFNLSRQSDFSATIEPFAEALNLPVGVDADILSDLRMIRLAYSYSLMSDAQKELGFMVGLHVSRMHTEIVTAENDQEILTSSSTPLPAMGLHGTVALGRKTYLRAYLQLFRMHFDHFSGSMNHLNVVLQHAWRRNWSVGLGYSLYDLKLDSEHSSIDGSIEIRHHGPQIFLGVHF